MQIEQGKEEWGNKQREKQIKLLQCGKLLYVNYSKKRKGFSRRVVL